MNCYSELIILMYSAIDASTIFYTSDSRRILLQVRYSRRGIIEAVSVFPSLAHTTAKDGGSVENAGAIFDQCIPIKKKTGT
jgi:hypothetical protein